jgi:hypothetical protein
VSCSPLALPVCVRVVLGRCCSPCFIVVVFFFRAVVSCFCGAGFMFPVLVSYLFFLAPSSTSCAVGCLINFADSKKKNVIPQN